MIDIDQKFNPPTREQLAGDIGGVAVDGDPEHGPYIVFRAVCGADGYFCAASFRDAEGYGGGATPRAAMLSLAASLRNTADRIEAIAARCECDLRRTDGNHVRTCPTRARTS